jgi:two-component system phosphate regulon response regulator PhoB
MAAADKRILVVDDDEEVREVLVAVLQTAGFTVVAVGLTEDALEVLRANPPDLIVLDLVMPRGTMQGMEFLAAVREVEAWKTIPVIILSAYGDVVNRDITTRLGAAAVLSKPLADVDLLPRTVRAVLR